MERSLFLKNTYSLSVKNRQFGDISNTVTEIVVCENFAGSPSQTTFSVMSKPRLKSIEIESSSFPWVESFQVSSNPNLQSVRISRNCFASNGNAGYLVVKNCPKLTEFTMGPYCFVTVTAMIFSDLPVLSDFSFNPSSLQKCQSITFTQCGQLNQIAFPRGTFPVINTISISKMDELQIIVFGEDSCCGGVENEPAFSCRGEVFCHW